MPLKYKIFWCCDQDCLLFSEDNSTVLNRHRNETDTVIAQDSRLCSNSVIKKLAAIVVPGQLLGVSGVIPVSLLKSLPAAKLFLLQFCRSSKKSLM